MKHLAIIPARGGSKGVPRKNTRLLAGKPLVAWSVAQALACPQIDRVVVSTDDPEIADIARAHGAEVPVLRPSELAVDVSPTEPALIHMVRHLERTEGYCPDTVVLLQPTSPLRKAGRLSQAIAQFVDQNADSLLSVVEIHPFLWRNPLNAAALYDYKNRPRRQDIPDDQRLYKETGSIYVTRTDILLDHENRLGGRVILFSMDEDEASDIDTLSDFFVVDALMKSNGFAS